MGFIVNKVGGIRMLAFSVLCVGIFICGCSRRSIVGKWKLRPSRHGKGIQWIEVFNDGLILRHETSGDFTDRYRKEGDKYIINDDEMTVTRLTRSMMIWTQSDGNQALVYDRQEE